MEKEKTSPWIIVFRVIFTIALIWVIGFIFGNSLQDGATSSRRSQRIVAAVNGFLAKVGFGPISEFIIRKLAHFAEFTLLGFVLMMCLRVYTSRFISHISWPLLGGIIVALSDETIQLFIPGRSSQVRDVWIDTAGVCAGIAVAFLILLIVSLLISLYKTSKENKRLRAENARMKNRTGG